MKIVFNKIEPQTVEIWNNDGFFAHANEYEFNNIRIQIMKYKAEGFYALFEGQKIRINSDGRVENWPKGFFDLFDEQLTVLVCV
jgi:predicted ATPase